MLGKFKDDQRSMAMSSINCLNSSFCSLKYCIKDEFMDQMINYIRLVWKLACMLRTYRTCNSKVRFSKYEFYNKLLGGVKLFKVTSGVTWTQSIYMCFLMIWKTWKSWVFDSPLFMDSFNYLYTSIYLILLSLFVYVEIEYLILNRIWFVICYYYF